MQISTKHLLRTYGLSPRKRFGQNFLLDRNIANKIVALAGLSQSDIVIEIGPGLGILTERFVDTGAKVVAIELDRKLVEVLQKRFLGVKNLEVINEDALQFSYRGLSQRYSKRLKVVSNLPYNTSTPILFKFLDERDAFFSLLLMLQREVAERIVAVPGTKDYGVLSVFMQLYTNVKIEFSVPPSVFYPRPEVYSSLVRFNILDRPKVEVKDHTLYQQVVKAAFGRRRKTLFNALKTLGLPSPFLDKVFKKSGIDPKRRGETLTLEEFGRLSNAF